MNIFHAQFFLAQFLVAICGYLAHETPGMWFCVLLAALASYCAASNAHRFSTTTKGISRG